eukprot:gb/GEZJ01003624.1/.p2 GENE.gb/GEZJ01003624.1/~~gb/GEZJ01003624.1/.p2  ORF type:complete len:130 (-),score=7.62 gb/GEZJ01003624.1/:1061-1450(-)
MPGCTHVAQERKKNVNDWRQKSTLRQKSTSPTDVLTPADNVMCGKDDSSTWGLRALPPLHERRPTSRNQVIAKAVERGPIECTCGRKARAAALFAAVHKFATLPLETASNCVALPEKVLNEATAQLFFK